MNTSDIRKVVTKFRKEYDIQNVTVSVLEDVFRRQGVIIIDFNPAVNDPDVTTIIDSLGHQEMISYSNGFVYLDDN